MSIWLLYLCFLFSDWLILHFLNIFNVTFFACWLKSVWESIFFFREIRYKNSWNWFPYNIHVNEKVCTLHQFSYHHLVFRMIYYFIIVRPYFSSFHPNLMASLSAIFNGRFHHFCAPLAAFTYLSVFLLWEKARKEK